MNGFHSQVMTSYRSQNYKRNSESKKDYRKEMITWKLECLALMPRGKEDHKQRQTTSICKSLSLSMCPSSRMGIFQRAGWMALFRCIQSWTNYNQKAILLRWKVLNTPGYDEDLPSQSTLGSSGYAEAYQHQTGVVRPFDLECRRQTYKEKER